MKTRIMWLVIGSAVFALGVSMPSCPGQQAMQSQMDALQTKDAENQKKLLSLDSQVKHLSSEINQTKQIVAQFTQVVVSHKSAIEDLTKQVAAMGSKSKPPVKSKPISKPAPKADASKKKKK